MADRNDGFRKLYQEAGPTLEDTVSAPERTVARRSKVFFGWYVVAACFIALFVHSGIGFYAFGTFFTPLEQDLGWSRAEISAAMAVVNVLSGLSGPFIGRLTDIFGPRKVMAAGAGVFAICFIALAGVSFLWQYYLVFLASALPRMALSTIPVGLVISNWFRQRRGLAMGIAVFGIGVGGLTMAPLASYIISFAGWRWAAVALGLIAGLVAVPMIGAFVRRSPQEMGLHPFGEFPERGADGSEPLAKSAAWASAGLTFREALKTPAFWLISISLFLVVGGPASVMLHLAPFFEDAGESPQMAATILALTAGMGGIGKLTMGYVGDKIPSRFALVVCFVMQAVGLALIMLPMSAVTVAAFVVVYGLGMGGVMTLQPMIAAESFGVGSLGTIIGGLGVLSAFSYAGGPILAGYIFDTTGSYTVAFWVFLVAALTAIGFVVFAKPANKGVAN